ncbi:internal alternative NAD(P)H-ubiquinone oxidoreductase A1, mitochondrial-like [Carex rostrata]
MALSRIARGSSLSQSFSKLSTETPQIVSRTGQSVSNNARQVQLFTLVSSCNKTSIQNYSKNIIFQSRGIGNTTQFQHPSAQAALDYDSEPETERVMPELGPTKGFEKPRVVVLGTGWGACRFLKDIDTKIYDVVCISPRNHMVFTPLLASTCVGTLEFRSVSEPVSRIQDALAKSPGSHFFLANCTAIDSDKHEVYCTVVTNDGLPYEPYEFKVAYDKLVISVGAEPMTFNIKGVYEHATFLREVYHAQKIRQKLLLNLMLSDHPGISVEEKRHLLHCVVVGGGPTGVEFTGELSDFIMHDVRQRYTHAKDHIKITLIEGNELLGPFDPKLRQYATNHLAKSGVNIVKGIVQEVQKEKILLKDGTEIPYGLLVWSTGVGPSKFVNKLDLPKSRGRIGVDEWLRVPSVQDVFALGDCAGYLEHTGKEVLPALAQVAERQGKYLATVFATMAKQRGGKANQSEDVNLGKPFEYHHLGSMASVGRYKALVDLKQNKDSDGLSHAGFLGWLMWRTAYLTRTYSWRNRIYVAANWATTLFFGRDNSRIGV